MHQSVKVPHLGDLGGHTHRIIHHHPFPQLLTFVNEFEMGGMCLVNILILFALKSKKQGVRICAVNYSTVSACRRTEVFSDYCLDSD